MQSKLFMLLLLAALAAPALSNLQCPSLAAETICADAEPGFGYSDGCNRVTCSGYGRYATTLKWCPGPTTAEHRRKCRQLLAEAVQSLGPQNCPNLRAERICRGRAKGFQFSDGCNGVTCGGSGDFASTMMMCPRGDPGGVYCRLKEAQLDEADDKRRRRRR